LVDYNRENDLALAVQTILDRQQEYEKAEKYYKGEVDEVFASPSVRRALSKIGSDFRINFAAMPVDAVAARLEIDAVKAVSAEGADVLDAVFEDAELELELKRTFKNALMFGDAYMFVWPDSSGSVQAYYNSPKSTVVLYDPENPRVAAVAAKVWVVPVAGGDPTQSQPVLRGCGLQVHQCSAASVDDSASSGLRSLRRCRYRRSRVHTEPLRADPDLPRCN